MNQSIFVSVSFSLYFSLSLLVVIWVFAQSCIILKDDWRSSTWKRPQFNVLKWIFSKAYVNFSLLYNIICSVFCRFKEKQRKVIDKERVLGRKKELEKEKKRKKTDKVIFFGAQSKVCLKYCLWWRHNIAYKKYTCHKIYNKLYTTVYRSPILCKKKSVVTLKK